MSIVSGLRKRHSCAEAIAWINAYGIRSYQRAWNECDRPGWMLFWLTQGWTEARSANYLDEDDECRGVTPQEAEALTLLWTWYNAHPLPTYNPDTDRDPIVCNEVRNLLPKVPSWKLR